MKPTEILSSEHRVIEQVLDCLESMAQIARDRRAVDTAPARQAVRFLRTFADTCHHHKEEERLFPMLYERGMPRGAGPVAVMLDEHETGRRLIREMAESIDAAAAGNAKAPALFSDQAFAYVELMREHIAKEDHVLFPMAEGMLRDADRERLLASFREIEHAELGAGTHAEMERIADELAELYGVARGADRAAPPAFGGCCHGAHVGGG